MSYKYAFRHASFINQNITYKYYLQITVSIFWSQLFYLFFQPLACVYSNKRSWFPLNKYWVTFKFCHDLKPWNKKNLLSLLKFSFFIDFVNNSISDNVICWETKIQICLKNLCLEYIFLCTHIQPAAIRSALYIWTVRIMLSLWWFYFGLQIM